ncbi:MAG: TlpA family protein disulfide reductase [Planctomycetes bacterium]|nr:TlpA family protein disulfide reductase [Planctomycetota bacterium]
MQHVTAALLTTLVLAAGCSTSTPEQEQPAKADTAAAAPQAITPVNSWAHFRELRKAQGKSDAEIDEMMQARLASMKTMDRTAGDDRVGAAAPPFQFDAWFNTEPLTLEGLRGRVLLVRWWTETCPFCASSAPALRALHDEYAGKGLTVIGVFHPKAGRDDPIDLERVRRAVETRQFDFPIAVDWDWRNRTLKQWWLTGPGRPATSVTFVVDKAGVIRFVHPGMEYHDPDGNEGHEACHQDMATIRATIERLLAE